MKKRPKRIYVVGSTGSGKTTLAKRLAKKLNYPHIDLDDLRYPPKLNKVVPIKKRIPALKKAVKKEMWVAEGVYVAWTKPLLERAEAIIWLDIPLHIALPRITRRYIKNALTGKDRYGFISFLELVKFLFMYHHPKPGFEDNEEDYFITREKTHRALKPHKKKVLQAKRNKHADEYVKKL